MSGESKVITVKLKRAGWEVEITCTPEQLRDAVVNVLASLSPTSTGLQQKELEKDASAGNKTCRGLILELWQDSWFAQARSLSEVHDEISRRGYHYDRTAVSHSLTDLVRENVLTRQGNMRSYTYIQKKPPYFAGPQEQTPFSEEAKEQSEN